MRSVLVVVTNIVCKQTLQINFVECDDVVEQITASTLDPPFGYPVLPGAFKGCPNRTHAQGADGQADFKAVRGIAVEDQELRCQLERERFAQLLNNPGTCWVPRDIEVHDATAIMADDEKAVEDSESDSWNREEVHRRNHFPMVSQKREPWLGRLRIPRRSLHPTRDRSFGNVEAEHQEFAVDSRRAPRGILRDHAEDQISELFGSLLSANRSTYS